MTDLICRGKPLTYLVGELMRGSFGCEDNGFVGGFSTDIGICAKFAMGMDEDGDFFNGGKNPAAFYTAPLKRVKAQYGEAMQEIKYDAEWLITHPDVLEMIVGDASYFDNRYGEDADERMADHALQYSDESEVVFFTCPLRTFVDKKGKPLGTLDVKIYDFNVLDKYHRPDEEDTASITEAMLNEYIDIRVMPQVQELRTVKATRIFKCGAPWTEDYDAEGDIPCLLHRTIVPK